MRERSQYENIYLLPVPHQDSSSSILVHLASVQYLEQKAYLEHMLTNVLYYDLAVSIAYLKRSMKLGRMFREQRLGRNVSKIRI